MKQLTITICVTTMILLSGCAASGKSHRSDTYTVDEVNTSIQAKTVNIIAILNAKVAVSNSEKNMVHNLP